MLFLQGAEILHGGNRWEGKIRNIVVVCYSYTYHVTSHYPVSVSLVHVLSDWWSYSHFLLCLLQHQRPRERLCLFVLLVIPLSLSYNEMACQSRLPVASWRSFTVRPQALLQVTETLTHALVFKLSTSVKIPPVLNSKKPPHPPCLYQLHPFLATCFVYGTSTVICSIFHVSTLNEELDFMDHWDFLQSTVAWKSKDLFPLLSRGRCKACRVEARIRLVVLCMHCHKVDSTWMLISSSLCSGLIVL